MIKVSTRGRYALRAMLDLALHTEQEPVPRQEIADRQDLSADYVAQLFRQLRDAGLVTGVKGPSGGYALARPASSIRVGEVIRAVEGPIALVDCVLPTHEDPCLRLDCCVAHLVWSQLSQTVTEFLDSISLGDLCDKARGTEPLCTGLEVVHGARNDRISSHGTP